MHHLTNGKELIMAKSKRNGAPRGTTAQAIRALFTQGITSGGDVFTKLEEQGIKTTRANVYAALTKLRKDNGDPGTAKRRGGRGGKRAEANGASNEAGTNGAAGAPSNAEARGNASQAIRELYNQGITSGTEVFAMLQEQGIKTSKPNIYATLTRVRKENGRGGSRRKPGRRAPRAAASEAPSRASYRVGLTLEDITAVIDLAKKAGGLSTLRAVLDSLAGIPA